MSTDEQLQRNPMNLNYGDTHSHKHYSLLVFLHTYQINSTVYNLPEHTANVLWVNTDCRHFQW